MERKQQSQAGKETLLRSVAMALPINDTSCFRIPKPLWKKYSEIAELWSSNDQHEKTNTLAKLEKIDGGKREKENLTSQILSISTQHFACKAAGESYHRV